MTDTDKLSKLLKDIDNQLTVPNQMWLFGAGISYNAGIPLMGALTRRVEKMLAEPSDCLCGTEAPKSKKIFELVRKRLRTDCHVEHVLSQIGDLISIASRHADESIEVSGTTLTLAELKSAHRQILLAIRYTVEFGYREASAGKGEEIGSPSQSIVSRKEHDRFAAALVRRRGGIDLRPAVRFFTTNYDTLLEDAMSGAQVSCVDGFSGGATGFWDHSNLYDRLAQAERAGRHVATLAKLHGSIDWVAAGKGIAMRVRSSTIDPSDSEQGLLIYPQAIKYQVTQRDPFAALFSEFRTLLSRNCSRVLVICGYSFGDEHVNDEIEHALRFGRQDLTVLALCYQQTDANGFVGDEGLPEALARWLRSEECNSRLHVLGSRGYYRGNISNQLDPSREYGWWTFGGVSDLLENGAEASV